MFRCITLKQLNKLETLVVSVAERKRITTAVPEGPRFDNVMFAFYIFFCCCSVFTFFGAKTIICHECCHSLCKVCDQFLGYQDKNVASLNGKFEFLRYLTIFIIHALQQYSEHQHL